MKFKHWKEAEKRANELKAEIDTIGSDVPKIEADARDEGISVEKREELIQVIQEKVTKREALQVEYDEAIAARDTLKANEERQLGLLSNISTPRVTARSQEKDTNVYETRSYELAWADYIRSGNDAEVRALVSTQNSASAGILVPTTLVNRIEDTVRTGGRLLALCDMTNIAGITEYPIAGDRTDPELHDETGASKKEKEAAFTSVSMEPQFIAEILRTTRKFEADSISAFWDWLMAELPDALRRVIDRKILSGGQSAKDGIHGILTNTNTKFVEILPNHILNFNTANAAVSYLDDGVEDNVTIIMHRKTFFNNVMGLVGTDGHPIWQQVMTTNLNRPSFVMGGYPVVFTKELPEYNAATAGETYMVAGDFRAMKMNFPKGMNVNLIRDEITEMQDNIVRYLSEIYVAGNITRLGHFVKVTK